MTNVRMYIACITPSPRDKFFPLKKLVMIPLHELHIESILAI